MKKIALLFIVMATLGCQNEKKKQEEALAQKKEEFLKNCKGGAKLQAAQNGVVIDEEIIDQYCDCSAEYIFKELSEEEIEQLETQTPAMMTKLQSIVGPCLEDLVREMSKSLEEKVEQMPVNE